MAEIIDSQDTKIVSNEIGTVEPIGNSNTNGFILGAIAKYGDDIRYHESLLKYITKLATEENTK